MMYGAKRKRLMARGRTGATVAAVALCGCLVLLISACGSTTSSSAPSSGASSASNSASGQNYRVGVVLDDLTNPAIQAIADGMSAEVKSKYPQVHLQIQGSTDLQDEVAKAQTMITSGVSALGLEAYTGPGVMPVLQQAKSAHIPVFMVEDNAPGAVQQGLAVTFIAADETQGGYLVGQAMAKALGGRGKVAIVEGAAGDATAEARTAGFMSAIRGTKIKVVASADGNWEQDTGLSVTGPILTANPDLNGIFAENDLMGLGALQAIQQAHKEGRIFLAGYNGSCQGLQATLQGKFQLDGILYLKAVGQRFVDDVVAYRRGAKVPPRDVLPIAALTTSQLQGVRAGTLTSVPVVSELRPLVQTASSGHC